MCLGSVAVKKLIDQELSGRMLEEFRMETSIMKRLRHVNILLFLGAVSIPGHLVGFLHSSPGLLKLTLAHRKRSCGGGKTCMLRSVNFVSCVGFWLSILVGTGGCSGLKQQHSFSRTGSSGVQAIVTQYMPRGSLFRILHR